MPLIQQRSGDGADLQATDFLRNNNPAVMLGMYDSLVKGLPGLIGYWPGSVTDINGRLLDDGPNALHVTNNNTAVLGQDGLAAYFGYNGTTQYHSIADTANLDILGTEAFISSPGLTVGAWIWTDSTGSGTRAVAAKRRSGGAANSAYFLWVLSTGEALGGVTQTGTGASVTATSSAAVPTDNWAFVAMRFTSGSSVSVFLNGTGATTGTSLTTMPNNAVSFTIGAGGLPSDYFKGRVCRTFLCAAAVRDVYLFALYQYGRHLFGV